MKTFLIYGLAVAVSFASPPPAWGKHKKHKAAVQASATQVSTTPDLAAQSPTTQVPGSASAGASNGSASSVQHATKGGKTEGGNLESVLTQMDEASERFRSAETDFEWDQYQKVVDETDVQKGKAYFVRHEHDSHMAADITSPEAKRITYDSGKIKLYQPGIDQLTEYDAGKSKDEVESFLVLGFGGRGHDLPSSFSVRLAGWENVDGVKTAKLELTPKAAKVRNMFSSLVMWVDPTRDISLKQQAFEPSGDYRITKYTNIRLNANFSQEVFKIKTTGHTKIVRP